MGGPKAAPGKGGAGWVASDPVVGPPWVLDYRATFGLPAPPAAVWDRLEHLDQFPRWWGWLSDFRVEGGGLQEGSVWRGVVSPPVPYRMRVEVDLEECEAPYSVDAAVHGDLEGRAGLLLEPDGTGTRATVGWTIEMMQRPMRLAARVAHPMLQWGHDRVVEATVRGFSRQLADRQVGASADQAGHHQPGGQGHHPPRHRP